MKVSFITVTVMDVAEFVHPVPPVIWQLALAAPRAAKITFYV